MNMPGVQEKSPARFTERGQAREADAAAQKLQYTSNQTSCQRLARMSQTKYLPELRELLPQG